MEYSIKEKLELINQQLKEITGIYQSGVSKSNILGNEFWIWYSLVIMEGEYSQQDICNIWSLTKQTVNTIITQFVRKKYVVLEVVPGTRNRKIIKLTDEGRKYGEGIVKPIAEAEQRAFGKLPIEDQISFSNILAKYIDNLRGEIL